MSDDPFLPVPSCTGRRFWKPGVTDSPCVSDTVPQIGFPGRPAQRRWEPRGGELAHQRPRCRGEEAQAAQLQPASGSPRCGGRMLRSLRCSRPPAAEAIAGRCCGRASRGGASRAAAPRGVTAARHPEVAAWQSPGRAGRALSENPEFCQEGRKRKSDEDNDFGERPDRKQLGL